MFFGVLRICKLQHAANPSLAMKRPATTIHVYDLVKTRMDEAIDRVRRFTKYCLTQRTLPDTLTEDLCRGKMQRISLQIPS